MHEKSYRVSCHICGKTSSNRTNLRIHVNTVHTEVSTVVCEHCSKSIKSTNIKSHVKEMHDNYGHTPCPVCGKIFLRRKLMTDHMRNTHGEASTIVCEYCSKPIKCANLKNHVKEMHDDYGDTPCLICGKVFPRRKTMMNHMRNIHTDMEGSTVECEKCSKPIKSTNIKNHVKEMHVNYVDTPCPICGKIFPRRKAMTDHLRNIHTNRKA